MKRILKSKFAYFILSSFFSLFYEKRYLRGYYFQERFNGWKWAWHGLQGRRKGNNKQIPWPVNPDTVIVGPPENFHFDVHSLQVFQTPGCYWQAIDAHITVGANCYVAPNVGVITTNHDIHDPSLHTAGSNISIGDNCWLGMNSVILPGVVLGNNTVVAAGAVVTRSFPEGHCVLGGVPAKVIKNN